MLGWLKRFWYWTIPALLGGLGALWALLKPRPAPAPRVSDKDRESAHRQIEDDKEEKIEATNNLLEDERRAAHDLFDDTD